MALFSFLVVVLLTGQRSAQAEMAKDKLWLVTAAGETALDIEVAETSAEKAVGLMFRTHLPENSGMLFPYEGAQELTMWMRNTYIPLDMVFIRPDGVIHRIATNTTPLSEDVIASRGPVSAVLELAAGAAVRLGLKPGDRVRNARFGK